MDFQGPRVTSDGGLIVVRELDERLGFGELVDQHLTDSRRGKNTQFRLADLFRQSAYSRLAGYEGANDAERVSQGPTFRLIGSEKVSGRGAAAAGGQAVLDESATTVGQTGGRLIQHGTYFWLLLAESHLTRPLFGVILRRVWVLPAPAG